MNIKISHYFFALLVLLWAVNSLHAQCTRCAILMKDGAAIDSDLAASSQSGYYGPADNLEGPALENKYFAPFISVMGSHIYHDCLGKRMYIPVVEKFINDTKRHNANDWGFDIYPSGGPYKPGVAYFGALIGSEVVFPQWADIESVETRIVSADPDDTEISFTFRGWNVGGKNVTAVWSLSTNWDARWIKHTFEVPPDFGYSLVFGTSKHLANDNYSEDPTKLILHALSVGNTYNNFAPISGEALIALKSASTNFENFFYNNDVAGIRMQPNAEGQLTGWNLVSWAGEPSPLFEEANWQEKMFEGTDVTAINPNAQARLNEGLGGFTYTISGKTAVFYFSNPDVRELNIYDTSGQSVFSTNAKPGKSAWHSFHHAGVYVTEVVYESGKELNKITLW